MKKWIKLFFRKKGADKPIFMAIFVLICLGIVMIGSASIGAVSKEQVLRLEIWQCKQSMFFLDYLS